MATSQEEPKWRSRNPQRAVVKQREAQRLREVEGLTFQEIAEALGYANKSSAKRAYDKAVADGDLMDLTDNEWRDLQLRRLERLYALAAKSAASAEDPLGAIEKAAKIHDRIVRLKGLDIAPAKAPVGGTEQDRDDDESNVVSARRLQELRERRARDAADRAARR